MKCCRSGDRIDRPATANTDCFMSEMPGHRPYRD